MVERDYSMMITKQERWSKILPSNCEKPCMKYKRKCVIIDTKTEKRYIFSSLREADIEMGFGRGCTTMAVQNKGIIQKRYRAEYYEA